MAGCSVKTLRRAVRVGQLRQRYAMSPRGPVLLFGADDLTNWRVANPPRAHRGRVRPPAQARPPSPAETLAALQVVVADLQAALAVVRQALARLQPRQHQGADHEPLLPKIEEIASLLIRIEGHVATIRAPG